MKNITHITQVQGLGFISPRPRARLDTTITARAAATKSSTKCSTAVQNSTQKRYIIYIMENKNTLNKYTHLK